MIKNKAYQVITTFNTAEMKAFELFLLSPYYNSNKAVIKLFQLIRKHIQKAPIKPLLEEELFTRIYPAKKYNYGIMKNLLSDLFGQCEKFLAVHPLEEDQNIEFEDAIRR